MLDFQASVFRTPEYGVERWCFMATVVKITSAMEATASRSGGHRFNWKELMDGQARKFIKGVDYANVSGKSDKYITNYLRVAGQKANMTTQFLRDPAEKREHFILRYIPNTAKKKS